MRKYLLNALLPVLMLSIVSLIESPAAQDIKKAGSSNVYVVMETSEGNIRIELWPE